VNYPKAHLPDNNKSDNRPDNRPDHKVAYYPPAEASASFPGYGDKKPETRVSGSKIVIYLHLDMLDRV